MAKSALSSWLSAPEPPASATDTEAPKPADEATDSPLDVGIAQLRGEGGAVAIARISPDKRALVEDIDTEEDDAEFDERAHWGRRRARKKARAAAGRKGGAPDKSQPSIAFFCVATAAREEEGGDSKAAGSQVGGASLSASDAAAAVGAEGEAQVTQLEEESPGPHPAAEEPRLAGDADAEEEQADHPVQTPVKQSRRPNRRQLRLRGQTPPAVNDLSIDSIVVASPADVSQAETPATNSAGRPKRQAAVRAEQMQQQGKSRAQVLSDEAAFLTPPPRSRRQSASRAAPSPSSVLVIEDTPASSGKASAKKGRPSEASPDVVELATKPASSGASRKRKLDLDKKKSPAGKAPVAGGGTPKGAKAAQAFFLTDQERKQLQEIEAVTSFREELRKAREKDLAFFTGSKGVNPFFQAPSAKSKRTHKTKAQVASSGDDSSAIEVDDDADTPDRSYQTAGKKWAKEAEVFPSVQHVLIADVEAEMEDGDAAAKMPPRRATPAPATGPEVVVLDDEGDSSQPSHHQLADVVASGNVKADEEASLADMFWFCEYRPDESDGSDDDDELELELDDRWATHVEGPEEDFIAYLVETYGVREKRVRELLASLEAARAKRLDKEANLTLVDRYLPVTASGIVGNKEPLRLLSSWLSAWKSGGNGRERNSCFQSELLAFEDDESEDEAGCDLHRLFILEGASGAGKSAAVYACAEELGYQVIEINAAQHRSGKSVVEIAGEATQSTRVLRAAGAKKTKTPPKKRKGGSSRRRSVDGGAPAAAAASQLSLVLFEDVDVVFEEDRGFLAAVCAIARRSKCPIVVTCAELPAGFPATPSRLCGALARPSRGEFSAWVALVAHLEGVALAPALVETMARFFDCDIRHALHFLQTNLSQLVSPLPRSAQWQWRGDGLSLAQALADTAAAAAAADVDGEDEDGEQQQAPPPAASAAVQAWTMVAGRSFDVLLSNLLPELRRATQREDEARGAADKTPADQREDLALLGDLAGVADAASLADTWVARCGDGADAFSVLSGGFGGGFGECDDRRQQLLGQLAPEPVLSFFQQERARSLARDVRRAALDALTAGGRPGERLLLGRPGSEPLARASPARCVRRTRAAALAQRDRDAKRLAAGEVLAKLELPLLGLGSVRSGGNARFMLDYLPAVTRLLSAAPARGEGRRRASRRNHYLREVLADMAAADELPRFCAYRHARSGGEETVAASPRSSPPPASAMNNSSSSSNSSSNN